MFHKTMTSIKPKDKNVLVQHISLQELITLLTTLLGKIGYGSLTVKDDYIIAQTDSPLSSHLHGFVPIDYKLLGSEDVSSIVDLASKIGKNDEITTIFIVSNQYLSKGFKDSISKIKTNIKIEIIDRDKLVKLVEDKLPDYWKHNDIELIEYEKHFCDVILKDSQLKKVKIFSDSYQKLLDIFIEPSIYHLYEHIETRLPLRKKVNLDDIIISNKPSVISGSAGSGKTTCLKYIGNNLIESNINASGKKNLPLFVSVEEIHTSNYDLLKLFETKISIFFRDVKIEDAFAQYKCYLLIDSIDELEEENQKNILTQLNGFYKKFKIISILCSRNSDKLASLVPELSVEKYEIERFNNEQIKQFVNKFFPNSTEQGELLLDALKENRIIEKLPITPLTLSLISILYEERNFEIPATITDIYDNFSSLLLGKPLVSSRIEFIDISFKERILSVYALEILRRVEHAPLSKDEFFTFFEDYFKNKTLPIKDGQLQSVLNHLIDHTGLLQIKHGKFVQFSHDSFMEYFAAIEVFKHHRELEGLYVENFFRTSWQNSTIFYAGKSKDMPSFLDKISKELSSTTKISEQLSGIMGMGYLLQALYQTDNIRRKNAIEVSIKANIDVLQTFLKIANDEQLQFKAYNLPIMWVMNIFYFYENFNSITLKVPLRLLFEEYIERYIQNSDTTTGYLTLKMAFTLASKRINEKEHLQKLIFDSEITKDGVLCLLTDFSLTMFSSQQQKELKKKINKETNKLNSSKVYLSKLRAGQARFSNFDVISVKRIKIITEGITDSEIIDHAYMVLTDGHSPYWSIKPAGRLNSKGVNAGGAYEVTKTLVGTSPTLYDDELVIGIYDHDAKGLQEFRGLKDTLFSTIKQDTIKKHIDSQVWAICLPVPGVREVYLQEKQEFNFFSIEHYFDESFLLESDAIKKSGIEGIFEIKDNKKKEFSKKIRQQNDPTLFVHFLELFKEIDKITGCEGNYIV